MACHRQPSTSGQHAPSLTLSAIEEIRSHYAFEARENKHHGRLVAKDSGGMPQKRPQLLQPAKQFSLQIHPYGPRWRLIRKISNIHIFGSKALDDLQPVREAEVGMLVKSIR